MKKKIINNKSAMYQDIIQIFFLFHIMPTSLLNIN